MSGIVSWRIVFGVGILWATLSSQAQLSYSPPRGVWPRTNANWRVTYGNGEFVAAGGGITVTSLDGFTWTWRDPGTNAALHVPNAVLAGGGGKFVGVWNSGSDSEAQVSTDGVTWGQPVTIPSATLNGVTFGNGQFAAVGQAGDGSGLVVTSSDGVNWSFHNFSGTGAVNAVTTGNGIFVAVGNSGAVLTSNDGQNWASQVVLPGTNITSVVYGDGLFVAGAADASLSLTSTNGMNWTVHLATGLLGRMAYGSRLFLALNQGVSISTNGVDWSYFIYPVGGEIDRTDIAYGAGVFVVLRPYGPGWVYSPNYALAGSRQQDGSLILFVTGGGEGQHSRIQAASALPTTNWVDLFDFVKAGPTNFLDTEATNYRQRFYRVASP